MTLFVPRNVDFRDWREAGRIMDENFKRLQEIDAKAAAEGTLLHRYISEPFADGRAFYQIVRVNKKTVRIRVCSGLGDDWVIPYWGPEATIDIEYAEQKVRGRDKMAQLFGSKTKGAGNG